MTLPGGKRMLGEQRAKITTRPPHYWPSDREGKVDPYKRIPNMDEMEIDTAVLFGGHCFLVEAVVDDPMAATVTLQAYNDYLSEYCSASPDRLKGAAMVSIQASENAAAELRRAVKKRGMVAAVVPPHHANGLRLNDTRLHPLYEAA